MDTSASPLGMWSCDSLMGVVEGRWDLRCSEDMASPSPPPHAHTLLLAAPCNPAPTSRVCGRLCCTSHSNWVKANPEPGV